MVQGRAAAVAVVRAAVAVDEAAAALVDSAVALRGGGGGESTEHRYNLTFSLNARNILNHENLNTFNGAITSPYFFQATGITGGFAGEATASNQRRMDLQIRFAF